MTTHNKTIFPKSNKMKCRYLEIGVQVTMCSRENTRKTNWQSSIGQYHFGYYVFSSVRSALSFAPRSNKQQQERPSLPTRARVWLDSRSQPLLPSANTSFILIHQCCFCVVQNVMAMYVQKSTMFCEKILLWLIMPFSPVRILQLC